MKMVYKGICNNTEQLPKGELPPNAVKFKEPNSLTGAFLVSAVFAIPALFIILLFLVLSYMLYDTVSFTLTMPGFLAAMICMIPHEFLHAICFGKNAEVELYIAPKLFMMFVGCTQPISKARYIFMSLLPNLIFGLIPLAIWAVVPYNKTFSNHLFAFAFISVLAGVGDYMNVFNAIRQMPKGSMQQLSGFNSYWFLP